MAIGIDTDKPIHTLVSDGLANLVEDGTLLGVINASLEPKLVFHEPYYDEIVPVGAGQKYTATRDGVLNVTDTDPKARPNQTHGVTGLDADLTPNQPKYDQFDINMGYYPERIDYRISDSRATVLNKIVSRIKQNAGKLGRRLNVNYRRALHVAGQFGHAYVTEADTDTAILTAAVSNLAGFNEKWVNGKATPVSNSNKIRAVLTHGTDRYLIDINNITEGTRQEGDDHTPGTITFTVVTGQAGYEDGPITELSEGDPIVALQATVVKRPGGKSSSFSLDEGDKVDFDDLINIAADMLSNGVEGLASAGGRILGLGCHKAWAQLMQNESFQRIYRNRYQSEEFSEGAEVDLLNLRLKFGNDTPTTSRTDGLKVRRIIFCGEEAAARGICDREHPASKTWDPDAEPYVYTEGNYSIMFDPETHIKTTIRSPIDVEADVVSVVSSAVMGFAPTPDSAARFGENPDAVFKRIGTLEFVG